jgi:phosphatidyl-myo-inositol alpha-mannosyltransferase
VRLAILHADLPPVATGGVAYQVDLLARAMVGRGHEVTVFICATPPEGRPYLTVSLPTPRFGKLGAIFGVAARFASIDLSGFDVVHAHGDDWAIRSRTPRVRTFHGSAMNEALSATSWKRKADQTIQYGLEWVSLLRASTATAVSANTLRFLPRIDVVVNNAVDSEVFYPGDERFPEPTILLVAGGLGGRKRGHLVIDAFRQVRRTLPDARLIIVSSDQVDEPGVECRAAIPQSELGELYRRSWALCSASSYEGFGLPYAEAMASGLPVVTTDNPGAAEVLDGGRLGQIVTPGGLARGLTSVLESRALADHYRAAGLVAAVRYSLADVTAQYEAIYQQAVISAVVHREQSREVDRADPDGY